MDFLKLNGDTQLDTSCDMIVTFFLLKKYPEGYTIYMRCLFSFIYILKIVKRNYVFLYIPVYNLSFIFFELMLIYLADNYFVTFKLLWVI